MLIILIPSIIVALFLAFLILLNFNFRFAYFLYKIPKINRLVSPFIWKNKKYLKATVLMLPHSIMPVIDDMGWADGKDLRPNGPSRLVKDRTPKLDDYINVIDIAKKSGIRIPGAFVVCDFDKENVCAKKEYNIPKKNSNLTEFGTNWNNNTSIEYNQNVINLLTKNSNYVEFGMHGVRHEHFDEKGTCNAEWANAETGESWGKDNTEIHCKVFTDILRQYYTENDFAFPKFFVPPSHAFALYSDDCKIINNYGIKRLTCSCSSRPSMKSIKNSGLFKDGVLLMDRTELNGISKESNVPDFISVNSWIGTHFPNYWGRSIKKWVKYLKSINKNYETMLGKNTVDNTSQWIYTHNTTCSFDAKTITINNTFMPDWAYENEFLNGIWLKAHLHGKNQISEFSVDGLKVVALYKDDFDNVYLRLSSDREDGALEQKIYKGNYKVSKNALKQTYVDMTGETFVLKNLFEDDNEIRLNVTVFGNHNVKICANKEVDSVEINEENVKNIIVKGNIISFSVSTNKMDGEDKTVVISYK